MKIVKINFLGKNYEIKCGDDEEQKIRILEARLNDKVNKDINKKNNLKRLIKKYYKSNSLKKKYDLGMFEYKKNCEAITGIYKKLLVQ